LKKEGGNNKMNEGLKPCPFCKIDGQIISFDEEETWLPYYISCQDDFHSVFIYGSTKEEVINIWNMRKE